MARGREEARRRRWADIVVIVVGVYAFLLAAFGPQLAGPGQATAVVRYPAWLWIGTGVAGILAVTGVIVALRYRTAARILTGAAGIVLLLALFTFSAIGWLALVTLILPALALLAATPFMGPMPVPEEEGREP